MDQLGRVLPDPDWPPDKAAPDELDLIRRFCNTCNIENGADRFETAGGLDAWLRTEGLSPAHVSDVDLESLCAFRKCLREVLATHSSSSGAASRENVIDALLAASGCVSFGVDVESSRLRLTPRATEPGQLVIGQVVLAVVDAQRDSRLRRFKLCDHCRWAYYDRSKNTSGRWCSMDACGGREKVRAFRRRQRQRSDT